MDEGEATGPETSSDPPRARRKLAQVHEWVFLTGSRTLIAGVLLVAFFVVVAAIELYLGTNSQQLVPLFYLSSAIIGGNFTLLTIVISINQLVISRQLSSPGELRHQIENTTDYRAAVTEIAEEEVPPPTPAAFLDVLLGGVADSARETEEYRADVSDDIVEALDEVLEPLHEQIRRSKRKLEAENTTTFEALVVSLNTNYSDEIYQISRLQTVHRDGLTAELDDCLDTLITGLKRIDVARQYLKTVYIQAELARLSRRLMYIGVPVVLVAFGLLEVFISTRAPVLSPTQLSVLTPAFATIGAAPLMVLFAYVLRLAVISERTAAITPFTTPTQEETPVEAITEDAED